MTTRYTATKSRTAFKVEGPLGTVYVNLRPHPGQPQYTTAEAADLGERIMIRRREMRAESAR